MTSLLAVNAPVLGLNLSFVDDTYSGKLPDIAVFQTGYITAFVVVSSVVPVFVAFVAVVAVPAVAAFKLATCVVLATVNGAVPVATVEVMTLDADSVVNAPAAAAVPPIAGGLARYVLKPVPLTVLDADNVVNAPVLAVVAPTVPLMFIEAVPVNPVAAPANDVALKTPVLGTKLSLVDDVVAPTFPVVPDEMTG